MTQILQQFRSRSRALAHGMVLVLLASWLAAVCPHCLAQTVEAPQSPDNAAHCHGEAPSPAGTPAGTHDCRAQGPVCNGAACAQLASVAAVEPAAFVAVDPVSQPPVAAGLFSHAWPATPPPPAAVTQRVAANPCPLYLRHCSFLN